MVKRVSKFGLFVAAVFLPTIFLGDPAMAISWGVKQPDGMVCRELFGTPHDHHGRGRGASRQEALAAAIRRWAGFVRFEYGKSWDDWGIARRKGVKCVPGSRGWNCKVDGQPCKH